MSELLRNYFLEFYNRFLDMGPRGFPLSFNVLEAFLNFEHMPAPFALKEESEFLIELSDFLTWSLADGRNLPSAEIIASMEEEKIYSYNFLPNHQVITSGEEKKIVVAGISIIRHGSELSCILLSGHTTRGKLSV